MSGAGRMICCPGCARVVKHQAKGLCARCYPRTRVRVAVCVDCGQQRKIYRRERCERCYRHASTSRRVCPACGRHQMMWSATEICRACRNTARAVGGACIDCHRTLPRLWGSRCSRCAKRHLTTGSCGDCLAWTTTISAGRCRACRDFVGHNAGREGPCRSCGRTLIINRYRRCRLCATARREAHLAGDSDWQSEPGIRGAIQLFIGDLYKRTRPDCAPDQQPTSTVSAPTRRTCPIVEQLELISWPAHTHRVTQPHAGGGALGVMVPDALAASVSACADARGWKPPTTLGVLRALTVLLEAGSFDLTDQTVAVLKTHRLPVSRVREFLTVSGMAPDPDDQHDWMLEQLAHLPSQIRTEVVAWIEVLEGRHGRSRPLSPHTVRHYLSAAKPALADWACHYSTLREVTTDDVVDQLDALQGSARVITAVALRSLFSALKIRRLVFLDPARPVKPGRFARTPVLGLDDEVRTSLLARLPRTDHRLVVLLAGVHALTRADILAMHLDDVDLDAGTITVRHIRRRADSLLIDTIVAWLTERNQRWPACANPHLLVTYKSAYGLGPASTNYITGIFKTLPTTAAGLRADRLLHEARHSGGDPLRLTRLFGLSAEAAVRYCNEIDLTTEIIADGS